MNEKNTSMNETNAVEREQKEKGGPMRKFIWAATLAGSLSAATESLADSSDTTNFLENTNTCADQATELVLDGIRSDLLENAAVQEQFQKIIDDQRDAFMTAGTNLEEQFATIELVSTAKNIKEGESSEIVRDLYNLVRECEKQIEVADFMQEANISLTPEMQGVLDNAQDIIMKAQEIIATYGT
jgi:hypothetical protein